MKWMVGYTNQPFFLLCKSFDKEHDNQEGAFGGKFWIVLWVIQDTREKELTSQYE